jgi:hypothetical protein
MEKTLTMGYQEYQTDLRAEFISGMNCGVSCVMKHLESGKDMASYILENELSFHSCIDPDSTGIMEVSPNCHWGRILKALKETKFR